MKKQVKFGECLRLILNALNISSNRLSQAINVDSSLVSRWLNEKRIPSYRSNYIEEISKYLSTNILNSFQAQRLNEVIESFNGLFSADTPLKEKILKVLQEAQGYSIECQKKGKDKLTYYPSPTSSVQYFHKPLQDNGCHYSPCPPDYKVHSFYSELTFESQLIFEGANIFDAGADLLSSAVHFASEITTSKDIYITFMSDWSKYKSTQSFLNWQNSLIKTLQSQWNITFLIKLDYNLDRILHFIEVIKTLANYEKIQVYYLTNYDMNFMGNEQMVITGIGALSCFATKDHHIIDCAFYTKEPAAVKALSNHFHMLITSFARPLIQYYPPEKNLDFEKTLAHTENFPGKCFFYMDAFNLYYIPPHLYHEISKKESFNNYLGNLDLYHKHLNTFFSNLQKHEYFNFFPLDIIDQLVENKILIIYTPQKMESIPVSSPYIIEFLSYIIELLQTYEHYHVAFIRQEHKNDKKTMPCYCMVKENEHMLFQSYRPYDGSPQLSFSVKEPMALQAFRAYFENLWRAIPPVHKNKENIIQWLTSKIHSLQ